MSRRLFRKRPELLLVDEELPLIELPSPPPPPEGGYEEEGEETDLYEDTDSFDVAAEEPSEAQEASAPLRVFLGSPTVQTTTQREELAAKVGGPVWDASAIGGRKVVATGSSPSLSRLGERPLKDALAEAAAALEDQGLGAAVAMGRPRAAPAVAGVSVRGSFAEPITDAPSNGPSDSPSQDSWSDPSPSDTAAWDEASDAWDSAADDDSWDAGAFGDEPPDTTFAMSGSSLSLELPPLVVPRDRLQDATTTISMDLPSEPPRGLLDDDPSLPIEAVEGDPAEGDAELSLPPRPASHDLLRYSGGLGNYGGRSYAGDDVLEAEEAPETEQIAALEAPEPPHLAALEAPSVRPAQARGGGAPEGGRREEFSWDVDGEDDDSSRVDPPTGVPMGVPKGSRLSRVKSASAPPRRPARPMPSIRPRAAGGGPGVWVVVAVVAVLLGVGGGAWMAGVFDPWLGKAPPSDPPAPLTEGAEVGTEAGSEAGEVGSAGAGEDAGSEAGTEAASGTEAGTEEFVPVDPKLMEELEALVKSGSAPSVPEARNSEQSAPRERLDTGRLIIRVNSPSTIYVNGDKAGETPMGALTLPAGNYLIKAIDKRTKRSAYQEVRIDAGVASEVRFPF